MTYIERVNNLIGQYVDGAITAEQFAAAMVTLYETTSVTETRG